MDNIFNIISRDLPKPQVAEDKQDKDSAPSVESMSTRDLVSAWQKEQTAERTEELLRRMQPTIKSAITSYGNGMEGKLRIRAANITLDALRTYKPSLGAEPSTFVFHALKKLNRVAANRSNIMPEGEGIALDRKLLKDVIDKFIDRKNREPSDTELADLTGFSRKRIARLLEPNAVVNESSTLTDDSQSATMTQSGLSDRDYYEYVYASVGPVDQKIMEWSSGMNGKQPLSNNAIAAKLKITPAAVSQRRTRIQKLMADVRSMA